MFGSHGFVGSHFWDRHWSSMSGNPNYTKGRRNTRSDYQVYTPDVLYFISTVHNYNIFESSHIDIDTNLTTLMTVLDNWHAVIKKDDQNTGSVSRGVFNFISSWFVYGDTSDPHNVKETDPCEPKGFYSITKRCAEQLIKSYCETFGLNYRILRLANVVGPGDQKISKQKNALQFLINQLKDNQPIEIYGDGTFYRDYIHVKDCADAINLVINKGNINDIYNIGNGKTWKFRDILYYARRELNSHSVMSFVEPKPFHQSVQVKSFYMDNSKLISLGYKPNYINEELYKSLL
jgi:nucleoside-diphosphate-sugar epimerase